MLAASVLLIGGLFLFLLDRHFSGLRAWDRPAWSRSRMYRPLVAIGAWGAMLSGIALAAVASAVAGAGIAAALAGLYAWTRWVRSAGPMARHLSREMDRLRAERPGQEDRDLLRAIVLARHPRWGEDLADQIVAENPDVRRLAGILIRMERSS